MREPRINRRELLVAGVGVGVAVGLGATARAGAAPAALDFATLGAGAGWPGWRCPGVANLRRSGGLGVLEAGGRGVPRGSPPGPVAPPPPLPGRGGKPPV